MQTMINGVRKVWLPVNQAWAVMWHDSVLRVFTERADADDYQAYLLRIDPKADADEQASYLRYQEACHAESLSSHDMYMWRVHGRPTGPL